MQEGTWSEKSSTAVPDLTSGRTAGCEPSHAFKRPDLNCLTAPMDSMWRTKDRERTEGCGEYVRPTFILTYDAVR